MLIILGILSILIILLILNFYYNEIFYNTESQKYIIYDKNTIGKIISDDNDITSEIKSYFNENDILFKHQDLKNIVSKPINKVIDIYDNNNKLIDNINVKNNHLKIEIINKDFIDRINEIYSTIKDDTIVYTFTDKKYLKIFDIFYDYYSKLNLDNLIVISLDKETYDILRNRNIKTIFVNYKIEDKVLFWRFRFEILQIFLKLSKKNLIHTDSDCIWFKNIIPLIKDLDNDLIVQMEHGMPAWISEKNGFIMCCGFYLIKYSNKGLKLLDEIFNLNINDDQVSFNSYIFDNKKKIEMYHNKLLQFKITLNNDMTVGFINHNYSTRNYVTKDSYNYHPYMSYEKIEDKINYLNSKLKSIQ